MEVVVGVVSGVLMAILCALFYRKGVKDGMRFKKTAASIGEDGEEVQSELMKKYELIMSYDPYGSADISNARGERV